MLYAKVVLWVKEEETISDSKVVLYRGDRNVDIEFTLKSVDYVLSESVEAQLVLVRPHAKSIFSKMHEIIQNKVTFTITGDMIDELSETESYAIQIRLFGPNSTARATLPPCYDVIYIRNPIATEPYNDGEIARANYAHANYNMTISDYENVGPVFIDGLYNKNVWIDGDLISVGRLNKIEDALYAVSDDEAEKAQIEKNKTDIADLFEQTKNEKAQIEKNKTDIADLFEQTKNEKAQIEKNKTDIVDLFERVSSGIGGGGMTEEERRQLEKNTSDISTILNVVDTPPTYTRPTLSISINPNTIQHNTSTSITIKSTFNANDAGNVVNYTLTRNGESIYTGTTVAQYVDTISTSHNTTISYSAIVEYSDGIIKDTLLGIPYPDTSIKAGSISSSGNVRAYALSYYGVVNTSTINDISGLSSRLSSNKSYTYTASLTEQRIAYIYPKTFGELTSIKDANNFDYINSYTRSTSIFNGVEYYVYILTDPVTINNFKQIFN